MSSYSLNAEQLLRLAKSNPDCPDSNAVATTGLGYAVMAVAEQLRQLVAAQAPAAPAADSDLRTQLIALLPTEPMLRRGLPNELADAMGRYGAFEEVAEVLGVTLPQPPNPDQ